MFMYPPQMHRRQRFVPVLVRRLAGVALLASSLGGLALASLPVTAQQAATAANAHPVSGRVYALPMSVQGEPWLWRQERDDEEEPDRALRLLKLKKGDHVADIGAGSGYMTIRLAKIVGPTGMVYANDISAGDDRPAAQPT